MTDLIKREDAIKVVESFLGTDPIAERIKRLPSADRPQGEWILECDAEGEGDNLYRCSECGQGYGCQEYDLPNYCPNCGAKMFAKGINVPNKKGADDEASD